ncbi:hypothetical protein C8Q80DRAFT_577738 [Daedaleopsis nitida]|nr:hypothetical protein C8Q80DRAFT_577738 [Daedaleopsis nitida]
MEELSSMADHAPDEIIESILHYALHIPSETFEAWRTPQTFAGSPTSSAWQALLVSSRWYYIGLPLLYEAAILRTRGQVNAFAEAVSKRGEDGSPLLGRYLRRLRMEATYVAAFNNILDMCGSGIRVLHLNLDPSREDDYDGLSTALQALNPSRLVLSSVSMQLPWTPWDSNIDSLQHLYDAVWEAAPTWTNVRRIDLSPGLDPSDMFIAQLATLPQMEYVSINFGHSCLEDGELLSILDPIASSPSLRVLQIRDGVNALKHYPSASRWPIHSRENIFLGEGENMVSLAEFPEIEEVTTSSSHLPVSLPDDVWYRILGYATHPSTKACTCCQNS